VIPDNWVRVTDKGIAASRESYVEYDEQRYSSPKASVYRLPDISNIMSQGQTEILVIDPYVDEDLLDMFASLDPSVKIRVLTEHLKGTSSWHCASCSSSAAESK